MSRDPVERLNTVLEGRYRVEHELGRGGMAAVYLAEDLRHGRRVAIKVLEAGPDESGDGERFSREIEIAARLNHPNILGLHDSGSAGGLRWFVMPYVEGESLRDVLEREGPFDLDRALAVAREVADALSYAHDQGLVHRDIKPENVLFQAGHAVVCDFGIAKAVAELDRDRLTRTGMSVGTLDYMSPEQLTDGAEVDARTDVYALGCLVHEMLEGRPPFTASTPQAAVAAKLMGDVRARSDRPDIPESVWGVVRRSLATTAEGRFDTASDLATALTRAATTEEIGRTRRRGRLRTVARAGGGVVAVAAIAAAASIWVERAGAGQYTRIGVMPLVNGAGDAGQDFYVRGVHEDLVAEMQRAGLHVLNPGSTRRLADAGVGLRQVADELGADALIEGSVERVGPRTIVDVRLVDGASEEIVWMRGFSAADIVSVFRDITLAIAEETGTRLQPEAEARLRAEQEVDPVLYELLLQGRFEQFQLTGESLDRAERYFQRAVERDSMSAQAWKALARVWPLRAQEGFVPGDVARARRDSILARAPIPGLVADDHALQLTWPDWQQGRWDEAEMAFLQELEQRPSDATLRAYYALLLLYLGRTGEAEREGERAARQAPDEPLVQGLFGQLLNALHRYDEAADVLTRAQRFDPDAPVLLSTLRTTYHLQGRDSLAIESWRESYRARGDLEALEALNAGYADAGYEAALRAVAELFEARREAGLSVSVWQIGTLYTRAGMYDEAVTYLALAADEGDPNCPYLSVDPIFDPMRGDPRFQALVDLLPIDG
jgi:serine/threonine-protein kinase